MWKARAYTSNAVDALYGVVSSQMAAAKRAAISQPPRSRSRNRPRRHMPKWMSNQQFSFAPPARTPSPEPEPPSAAAQPTKRVSEARMSVEQVNTYVIGTIERAAVSELCVDAILEYFNLKTEVSTLVQAEEALIDDETLRKARGSGHGSHRHTPVSRRPPRYAKTPVPAAPTGPPGVAGTMHFRPVTTQRLRGASVRAGGSGSDIVPFVVVHIEHVTGLPNGAPSAKGRHPCGRRSINNHAAVSGTGAGAGAGAGADAHGEEVIGTTGVTATATGGGLDAYWDKGCGRGAVRIDGPVTGSPRLVAWVEVWEEIPEAAASSRFAHGGAEAGTQLQATTNDGFIGMCSIDLNTMKPAALQVRG